MHGIYSDPEAMRYGATLPHVDLEQTRDWLALRLDLPQTLGEDFAIEHAGLVIGKAGFARFPELGFILRPDHWGRGLASEAVRAVLARAFEKHQLAAVEAVVDTLNRSSLSLLNRLGFVEVGRRKRTVRLGNVWRNSADLVLRAENWRASCRTS
jgi:[ribosomal protein S5]-alanine N-acetyltransferase